MARSLLKKDFNTRLRNDRRRRTQRRHHQVPHEPRAAVPAHLLSAHVVRAATSCTTVRSLLKKDFNTRLRNDRQDEHTTSFPTGSRHMPTASRRPSSTRSSVHHARQTEFLVPADALQSRGLEPRGKWRISPKSNAGLRSVWKSIGFYFYIGCLIYPSTETEADLHPQPTIPLAQFIPEYGIDPSTEAEVNLHPQPTI